MVFKYNIHLLALCISFSDGRLSPTLASQHMSKHPYKLSLFIISSPILIMLYEITLKRKFAIRALFLGQPCPNRGTFGALIGRVPDGYKGLSKKNNPCNCTLSVHFLVIQP